MFACGTTQSARPAAAHPLSLWEMFGITGGPNWDSEIKDEDFPGRVFANARMFYLQGKDFEGQLPSSYQPGPFRQGARWGGFNDNYYRTRNWQRHIPIIYHSWETLGKWPDKWFDCRDWGALETTLYRYTLNYLQTYCPKDTSSPCLVDVLEIGNEPWGATTPGPDCYARMLATVIQACRDYYGAERRISLSAAAFQNSDPDSRINDYIDKMLPRHLLNDLDFISGHFYPFTKGTHHTEQWPESSDGRFLELTDLVAWRDSVAPRLQVNLTETGWNSQAIGEKAQGAYILRALLLAARHGIHKFFYYELYDQPQVPIYSSCGLIGPDKQPKASYGMLVDFFDRYGHYRFKAVVQEDDIYIYELTDGQNLLYLAWDSGPYRASTRRVRIRGREFEVGSMPNPIMLY